MAVIDAGMSLRFSERFRAVTTISSKLLPSVSPADAAVLSSAAKDTVAQKTPAIPNARVARPTRIPTPRPAHNRAGRRTISLIITPPNRRFFNLYRLAEPRASAGSDAV